MSTQDIIRFTVGEEVATHEQAQAFADNYDAMLKEFREATQ